MKKIIFFDIDNTIVDNKTGKIPPNTLKMLEDLSEDENILLGIATGRGPGRLYILRDVLHYFDSFIYSNGTYIVLNNKVIYENHFELDDIKKIIELGKDNEILIGSSGLEGDVLLYVPIEAPSHLKNEAKLNEDYYLTNKIYQLWFCANDRQVLYDLEKDLKDFSIYHWTSIGLDINIKGHSKGFGIEKVKEVLPNYQVIAIGDGHNDIDMVEKADIGVAMENSRYNELKEKADYIGPNVSDDKLYDFLKEIKII